MNIIKRVTLTAVLSLVPISLLQAQSAPTCENIAGRWSTAPFSASCWVSTSSTGQDSEPDGMVGPYGILYNSSFWIGPGDLIFTQNGCDLTVQVISGFTGSGPSYNGTIAGKSVFLKGHALDFYYQTPDYIFLFNTNSATATGNITDKLYPNTTNNSTYEVLSLDMDGSATGDRQIGWTFDPVSHSVVPDIKPFSYSFHTTSSCDLTPTGTIIVSNTRRVVDANNQVTYYADHDQPISFLTFATSYSNSYDWEFIGQSPENTGVTEYDSGTLVFHEFHKPGSYLVKLTVTHLWGPPSTATANAQIEGLTITTPSLPNAESGKSYSVTFVASGGSGSYTWNWSPASGSSLPPGFSLDHATGVLSSTGSPAAPMDCYTFTVQVTDSAGNTASTEQPLTLLVLNPKAIKLVLFSIPSTYTDLNAIKASFNVENNNTLDTFAQHCGFANFNWQQRITLYLGKPTQIPGGDYDPLFSAEPGAYPFYYDQSKLKVDVVVPGCNQYYYTIPISTDTTLNFVDRPNYPECQPNADCTAAFTTQLVGVCSTSDPSRSRLCTMQVPEKPMWTWAPIFQWEWKSNYNSKDGKGGITITNTNGADLQLVVSPSQVTTTASGLAYSRVSQTFNGTVTVKNISSTTINGPLQILFFGMPANVTLVNATKDLSGTPYLTVPNLPSLAPGQSVTVSVKFKNPSNVTITFTPVIYSGSIN